MPKFQVGTMIAQPNYKIKVILLFALTVQRTSVSGWPCRAAAVWMSSPRSIRRSVCIRAAERVCRLGPPNARARAQLAQRQQASGYALAAPVPRKVCCITSPPRGCRRPSARCGRSRTRWVHHAAFTLRRDDLPRRQGERPATASRASHCYWYH